MKAKQQAVMVAAQVCGAANCQASFGVKGVNFALLDFFEVIIVSFASSLEE
ncbi:MAG: hypothetical protein Q4F23_04935 [Coriobacteriia bacterium]|nr:hypothetical protein [Coriobacteriia bacterium]